MTGYSFRPMMPFYVRWLHADTLWIESGRGRLELARVMRECQRKHGRQAAVQFRDALIYLGAWPVMDWYRTTTKEAA